MPLVDVSAHAHALPCASRTSVVEVVVGEPFGDLDRLREVGHRGLGVAPEHDREPVR